MEPTHATRMGVSKSIEPYELAIIFGAGASMPLLGSQRDLIPELWRQTTRPYKPGLPIHRLLPARAYLARTFRGALEGGTQREISFEDVVGPLEIAEAEEYWFHFADRDRRGRLIPNATVLDALDTWLAVALNPPAIPRRPSDAEFVGHYAPSATAAVPYARLIHLLMEWDCSIGLSSCR